MTPSLADIDIPGYKIETLIAEGGMASVYLAQQESLGRPVALKLLRKFDNPSQATRFFNEGRIIASLEHRNIITIYDLGVVGERHYLAMEYLQGGDLRARIDAGMTAPEVLELTETLSLCLNFVHRKGIIHRDIKPENILFRQDGSVVLTDFGVAKHMESNNTLTMDGVTLGSPYYMSPEQAQCKALDGRADIYSLGIVCYEMLTGSKPFEAGSPMETILAHLTSEPPPLPPHLRFCQPLLSRMIARNPSDRFASPSELVDFVRHLRATASKHKPHKNAKPRSMTNKTPDAISKHLKQSISDENSELTTKARRYQWTAGVAGLMVIGPLTLFLLHQLSSRSTPEQPGPAPVTASAPHTSPLPGAAIQPAPAAAQPLITDSKSALLQADAILKDKQLTVPQLKEAYDLYQVTLKASPRHTKALRGVNIIANRFIAIQSEIEHSLALADGAIKQGKLTAPDINNAADYYRHILILEPGHPKAIKGLNKLAGLFADRVETHLSLSETAEAERNLRIGLSLDAQNPRLLALAARIGTDGDRAARAAP